MVKIIGKLAKYKFQLLATMCANLISISHGAACGWLSPALLVLQSSNTPLDSGPLSVYESSWLGSVLCLGGLCGNLTFGFIANKWGRKKALCLLAIPQIGCWLTIIYAKHIYFLYAARVLAGLAGGGTFVTVPLFISDIASKAIRGSLGAFLMVSVNFGILIGFILGAYLHYFIVPRILICLPTLFLVSILFFPDTPQFLLSKNNVEGARKSICFYLNHRSSTNTKEINEAIDEARTSLGNTEKLAWKDFAGIDARRGIAIGMGLVSINILSGVFAIINYTGNIFEISGTSLTPNVAAIIVSSAQILGTYSSTLIVDHIKRRTLLILTSCGATLGFAVLGSSTYLLYFYKFPEISWLPVASLSFTIFIASMGYIPLTFVVLAEVLPRKIRPLASSFCNGLLNILAFTILKLFPILIETIGLYSVMWGCGVVCLMGVFFFIFFVPETKGKSI